MVASALPVLVTSASFQQSDCTHDSVHERLVLIYDPAKPMEERHSSSAQHCLVSKYLKNKVQVILGLHFV